MSALYAARFSAVNETLTEAQRSALIALRDLDVVPQGGYCFSTPVVMVDTVRTNGPLLIQLKM
jgi:roadblock/LC7 domain-containing protein